MEIKDKRTSHQEFKEKALKDPDVRKEYDRLKPVYEKIRQKIKQRITEEKAGIPKSTD